MKTLGYYNGKYGELDEMSIPMNDRVCWFGDGVYDAGPARNGKIFAIDEHIDRFFNSAGLLDIVMPVTKPELKQLLQEMVDKMDDTELFVYYQVTRGTGIRNHAYTEGAGNLWIMIIPQVIGDCKEPIKLITQPDTRFLHCNIKTLNLIPNCMAMQRAVEAGCDEVVFHRGDRVTEGAHSSLAIIRDGVFCTPPADELILPSITRKHFLDLCDKLGIPSRVAPFTVDELLTADEIMILSTGSHCIAVCEVDGRPVGGKAPALLDRLQQAYQQEFLEGTEK